MSQDPLRNFKFQVEIDHPSLSMNRLGFMSMSGLSIQTEMVPYREGGWNTSPHKIPGQSDFAPVTLTQGVFVKNGREDGTPGDALWEWNKQLYFFQWGRGIPAAAGGPDVRCDILIKVFDHPNTGTQAGNIGTLSNYQPGLVKLAVKLYNCWPGGLAFGDLNAGDQSVLVHSMTLHHEGFDVHWGSLEGEAPLWAS
jgi:phage tail-like protein